VPRFFRKKARGPVVGPDGRPDLERLSDVEFLDYIYKKMLGREADPAGKADQLAFLRAGHSRAELVLNITEAPEFIFKTVRDNNHAYIEAHIPLLPIKDERPAQFAMLTDASGREKTWVFRADAAADFDWIERKIIVNGYYERPGVWSFIIDEDKRLMAAVAAEFGPASVLDFGCANGAVLRCLLDQGIYSEGIEISRVALDKAIPEVRDRIHLGDLLILRLTRTFDVVLGLDIFEHLNPGKLPRYIAGLRALVADGGYLYANIPAYGRDEEFGEIFGLTYHEWEDDAAAGRPFRSIPVDNYGYPKNGHILCADTKWWARQFEAAGFRREARIERALHGKYDEAMETISPARRAFYVFSKNADAERNKAILERVTASPPYAAS
jgi:SAM-dependent methyltransferase